MTNKEKGNQVFIQQREIAKKQTKQILDRLNTIEEGNWAGAGDMIHVNDMLALVRSFMLIYNEEE